MVADEMHLPQLNICKLSFTKISFFLFFSTKTIDRKVEYLFLLNQQTVHIIVLYTCLGNRLVHRIHLFSQLARGQRGHGPFVA